MEFICLYILTFAAIIYVVKTLKPIFFKKKPVDFYRYYYIQPIVKPMIFEKAKEKVEPKMPMTKAKSKKNVKKTTKRGK